MCKVEFLPSLCAILSSLVTKCKGGLRFNFWHAAGFRLRAALAYGLVGVVPRTARELCSAVRRYAFGVPYAAQVAVDAGKTDLIFCVFVAVRRFLFRCRCRIAVVKRGLVESLWGLAARPPFLAQSVLYF